eukprot:SAG22_NODE_1342_length_4685_cov_3.468818_3_plen_908_part_00
MAAVLLVGPEATVTCEDGLVLGRGNPSDLKLCTGDKAFSRKCLKFESVGSVNEPAFAVSSLIAKKVVVKRGDGPELPLAPKGGNSVLLQNGDEIVLGRHPAPPESIYVLTVQVETDAAVAADGADTKDDRTKDDPAQPAAAAAEEAEKPTPPPPPPPLLPPPEAPPPEAPPPPPPMELPERKLWDAKLKKKKVQLEVTQMGLLVADAKGKPLNNYLYMSLGGWGEDGGFLQLDLSDGKQVQFGTAAAEEIADAMTAAARALAKQHKKAPPPQAPTKKIKMDSAEAKAPAPSAATDKTEAVAEEAPADEQEAAEVPEVGDKWRCVKAATIRESVEMDSETVEGLPKGSVIEVLEVQEIKSTGTVRVRCSRGWTSVKSKAGNPLLEKADASEEESFGAEGPAGAKAASPAASSAAAGAATAGSPEEGQQESPKKPKEEAAEPAETFVLPEQKLYDAKLKKKKVQLEVGGMGLQVTDQKGKPLDKYLYMSLGGWGEEAGFLQVDLSSGKAVRFQTDAAEEIAEAMTAAARVLAKQGAPTKAPTGKIKLESAEAAAPAPAVEDDADDVDADDAVTAEVGDKWRCVKAATIRTTMEMDSDTIEGLGKGSVIEVLEVHTLDTGIVRVRCSRGWTSVKAKSGATLLEKVDAAEAEVYLSKAGAAGVSVSAKTPTKEAGSPAAAAEPTVENQTAASPAEKKKGGGGGGDLFKASVAEIKKAAVADAAYKRSAKDKVMLSDTVRKYRAACELLQKTVESPDTPAKQVTALKGKLVKLRSRLAVLEAELGPDGLVPEAAELAEPPVDEGKARLIAAATEKAMTAFAMGDYEKAADLFGQALLLDKKNKDLQEGLAYANAMLQEAAERAENGGEPAAATRSVPAPPAAVPLACLSRLAAALQSINQTIRPIKPIKPID